MLRAYTKEKEELYIDIADNIKKQVKSGNHINLFKVTLLLEAALKGVETKKDLTPSEQLDIKRIRELIKGL